MRQENWQSIVEQRIPETPFLKQGKGGDLKVPSDSRIHAMHSCTLTQTHGHETKQARVNRKARL